MGKRSIIPYGPQHPVLPEPIHIDLVIEDERVIEAIPSVGFIHRGLESLVEKRDFNQMTYVAERTCGICSFQHGMGYCEAVEHVFGVEVPVRAKYLRTIWAELGRMHSHLLWLGLLADGFGFENLFYQAWRVREKVLDMQEMTSGGRLIFSVNTIGGVIKDITVDQLSLILSTMDEVEEELKVLQKTFLEDYSVQSCPKRAKEGDVVRVETSFVCDADLSVSVDGDREFAQFASDGAYEFTMPDHDVCVRVWIVSNGLA